MKAGVAGLVVAAEALAAQSFSGSFTLVLVADEEDASIGCEAAVSDVGTADVCLVAEPTWLDFPVAHRGYAVARVTLRGRAAHSSQPTLGRNAVAHLGRLLVTVERADERLRLVPAHPAAGHGSLIVTVAQGGSSPFVLAAEAAAIIERRTVPGESACDFRRELDAIITELHTADPEIDASYEILLDRDPWQLKTSGSAGQLRQALASALGPAPGDAGAPYWMESALWEAAGIPTLVCGPAGDGLHSIDEWVSVQQVRDFPVAVVAALSQFADNWDAGVR